MSPTLLVRLSIVFPLVGGAAPGSCNAAMAVATAALAARVASRRAAAAVFGSAAGFVAEDWACGWFLEVSAVGRGTAGRICPGRVILGPVGIALGACCAIGAGAALGSAAAAALTSPRLGFDSTGGVGALVAAVCLTG